MEGYIYSKESVQGRNWYLNRDIEKYRYNPKRIKNRIYADKFYKDNLVMPFPVHVIVEPTNRCNLQCPMCNRQVMTRKIEDMDLDIYKKVVDECAENDVHSISLYALGEPMLHKDIRQMITYAKGKGIPYVDMSTNAVRPIMPLLGTSLNEVIISIDGFRETFEKYRYPASYDTVSFNALQFIRAKEQGYDWPIVRIQCIETEETKKRMKEFVEYWLELGADVVYVKKMEAMSQSLGDKNISQDEINERMKNRKVCPQLYFVLTVNTNGDICYCCHDPKGLSVLGNIKDMTLKEAWCSMLSMRNNHVAGKYTEICKECVDYLW